MKKPLLDVIFASGKRKDVLLILQDGPMEMRTILGSLGVTRQGLLPQVRMLEEHQLVTHSNDVYQLTTLGEIVVSKMAPLLTIIDVFESDIDYWGTHNFLFIPQPLLGTIGRLAKCETVRPPITDLYSIYRQFHETSTRSESLHVATTFFFPDFVDLFSELIYNRVSVHFIISPSLLIKMQNQYYEEFKHFLGNEFLNFYVYKEDFDFLTGGYNDHCMLMRLLQYNGQSYNKLIVCSDPVALGWAKELFEYFLRDSVPLSELDFTQVCQS